MGRKIQLKRGDEANLPTLRLGEVGVTLDTKKLYFGTPTGNAKVPSAEEVEQVTQEVSKKADAEYVDTELAKKANATTVQGLSQTVNTKADAEFVETELAKKADVTALETKADKEEVTALSTRLVDKATKRDYDVRDYVQAPAVLPSPDWTVNRDAFQAANDAAAANGGGRVVAPPGEYLVKGIVQDSRVEFDLPGVTLKSPDGLAPHVIESRRFETTGSIATGDTELTVSSTDNIEKGTVVVIHHAGGILNTQFAALSTAIDATTTDITLSVSSTTFPTSGYMQVGSELIGYSSISGNKLNGVVRGALGSTAASHAQGDFIGVARHLYAEVTEINGNTLTLDVSPVIGVTNTTVSFGGVKPAIRRLIIDANKPENGAPSSVYAIEWTTVRWGVIEDVLVKNGDMGGIILGAGTTESTVSKVRLKDCGVWGASSPKGAGIWLFQGCKRNRLNDITVTGKGWVGIYIDDRTTRASAYDAPNEDNYVTNFTFDIKRPPGFYPPAISVVGSNRNKFMNGFVRGTAMGVQVDRGAQFLTADGSEAECRDNEFAGIHFDVLQPWTLLAPGNRLHDCTYTDRATSVPNSGDNLVYAVTTTKGEPIKSLSDVKFQRGTASAPGIAFVTDTDTGIYSDTENVMHMTLGGSKAYSFYGTEFRLADGVRIATGSGSGTKFPFISSQKLGFWGATPTTRPADIPNTTGATLEQLETELNAVKTMLRNIGLMG